jgi:molecular chaperone GrpE (heat shock protein)
MKERLMLAELAAANAAFDVIKQSIQNGKEIWEAGEAVAEYFGLKNEIQSRAHEHGYKSDLQAFMASEQLKRQEEELKTMFIYQGRPGQWDAWLQFQSDMKKSREEEKEEKKRAKAKRKKMFVNILIISSVLIGSAGLIGAGIYLLMTMSQ